MTQDWPRPAFAWSVVAILSVASLLSFLDRTILQLLSQPIKTSLALSDTELGLLQGAAFSIFYTAMIIPFGWVADHGNRIRMVFADMIMWSLATAASGLADGFWPLFVARVCVGIGEATLAASAASLISDHFPAVRRTMPLSVYTLVASAGVGVGLVGGGAVADWLATGGAVTLPGFGPLAAWQVIFVAVGLPGVLWAFILLAVPEPVRRETLDGPNAVTWRALIAFLRLRGDIIVPHFFGYCFYNTFAYGGGGWLPTYFIRVHGWTVGEVGWRYGLPYLIFPVVGGVIAGWVARRLRDRGRVDADLLTVACGNALMTVPGVMAPLIGNAWISLMVVMPLIALFVFPSGPSLAAIQDITPNRLRGRMTALYYAVTNLVGLSLGTLLIGLMNDRLFPEPDGVARSIALLGAVMCPVGALIVYRGAVARRRMG